MQKKTTINRILSLVLSCIMVVQLLPLSVFASAEEISGTCGDSLIWRIVDDTLYIEGEGAMYDYGDIYDEEGNWTEYISSPWAYAVFSHVELDDRITYIGTEAFANSLLESIDLPAKLTGIGNNAFSGSENLKEIELPEGLTEMGEYAFMSCYALETVTIPSTLKVIPTDAFYECVSLKNVTICEGVEEIGTGAFSSCFDMFAITVASNNYFEVPGLSHIEIPGSVRKIGEFAFHSCAKLTEVVLHEGLVEIGEQAFAGCNYLYEVTIPSTVQYIGREVFLPLPLDYSFGNMDVMHENPIGVQNLYILSETVSAWSSYPPSEDDTEGDTEGEIGSGSVSIGGSEIPWQENEPYVYGNPVFHAWEGSRAAEEITAYNTAIEEGTLYGRPITLCLLRKRHTFPSYTYRDEETHSRRCTDDGCTEEEVQPHTMVLDMENISPLSCTTDGYYRWICSGCDYKQDFVDLGEATGHEYSTYCTPYEDYHATWCTICGKDFQLPHEWAYATDPDATEPYDVEATCADCGYEKTITIVPQGATYVSVTAEDENGDEATLPENAFTVVWKDRDGNVLSEGIRYSHEADWTVTNSNPVIAVITFSEEVRQAYSVVETVEHIVTQLGEVAEYRLAARDLLTVTGKVEPLLGDSSAVLTTVLAGTESTTELELDRNGEFAAHIRRTSASITLSSLGYETVQVENIQMMPAVNGVIDLGILHMGDRYATEYVSAEYTDASSIEIIRYLIDKGAQVTLVGEDGTEFHGAYIRKYPGQTDEGSWRFRILMDRDISRVFELGETVTLKYMDDNQVSINPYTFTIARDGEQTVLAPQLEKANNLYVSLSEPANLFVFDESGAVIYSGKHAYHSMTLPKGRYTVVAFAYNNYIASIDSPGFLAVADVPDTSYVRETIDLMTDTELRYTVPDFVLPSEVGISVTFGTNLRVGDLIPIYVAYADKNDNDFAENVGLQLEFLEIHDTNDFPLVPVNGQYAFGAKELQLTEELGEHYRNLFACDILTVTTRQSEGVITLYARATGGDFMIHCTGKPGYTTVTLPRAHVEMVVPDSVSEPEGELYLYTMLSFDGEPYTANLYVDGELCSTVEHLNFIGNVENAIPYTLKGYPDGVSVHHIEAEVLNGNGEVIWSSPTYMLMLTAEENYVEPQTLAARVEHRNNVTVDWWELNKKPSGMYVSMAIGNVNDDNTIQDAMVLDYSLTMSNPEKVANGTVYMKIFSREDDPAPTINRIPLVRNPETGTFDGTHVLEANRYTTADMPYGYSFEYAVMADQELSMSQSVAAAETWAELLLDSTYENPYSYTDPDEIEFMLQNAGEFSDDDREMIRILLSIENDLHGLREKSDAKRKSLAAEIAGEDAVSAGGVDSLMAIMSSTSGITCERADGVTEAQLQEMGYFPVTASGSTFWFCQDSSGYTSVVDTANGMHYSFGSPASTYRRARSADEEGVEDFIASARIYVNWVAGTVQGILGGILEMTEEFRQGYTALLYKKLGLEGNAGNLTAQINQYRQQIQQLSQANLSADAASSLEAAQKALSNLDEIIKFNENIDHIVNNLQEVRAQFAAAAANLEDYAKVRPILRKCVTKLNALESGMKVGFLGLDLANLILMGMDAFDAYDVGLSRARTLANGEKTARNARENMEREYASQCLANPEGAKIYYDGCMKAYEDYMEAVNSAKSWNKRWFATKVGQVIGQIGSIAAGLAIKNLAGAAVSMGIGLAGAVTEKICLDNFLAAMDETLQLTESVNFYCIEPLPFEKTCEEEEEGPKVDDTKPDHKIPIKPNRTHLLDPSGYVYEAVASNRIEGATARAYYEGEYGEAVYWADADLYGEINPQTTNIEGRYAWMTPIGNWLVQITKDGYRTGTSENDPEAVNGWLPVPPPQMNVNIPLVSTASPTVVSAGAASDQIRVVFSQYMDIAQITGGGLVTVTQNGQPVPVTVSFDDAEVSPTDAGVYYGRVMRLRRADSLPFSGEGIVVTVAAAARNYAGNPLGTPYISPAMTVAPLVGSLSHSYPNRYVTDVSRIGEIVVQVLDTAGQGMTGVTVTARQKVGGTMVITESAVSDENGRARFTVKGISSGYDTVIFEAGVVRTEMNTRVSPISTTAPKKPTANLSDYDVVKSGTPLILHCETENAVIYYTVNDTCPCTDSAERMLYTGPILLTTDTYFRIASWTKEGGYSERLNLHITVKNDHVCAPTPVQAVGATCTDPGKEAYYRCACGRYFADANGQSEIRDIDAYGIISALGHTFTEQIADELHWVTGTGTDCSGARKYFYDCVRCAEIGTESWVSTEFGPHTFSSIWDYRDEQGHAHNCTVSGCTEHSTPETHIPGNPATETTDQICTLCLYVLVPALNHVCANHLSEHRPKEASCTEPGNILHYVCSCGKYYADSAASQEITDKSGVLLPAKGHEYTEEIRDDAHRKGTAASCQEKNSYWYDCCRCDRSAGDDPDAAHRFYTAEPGDHRYETDSWGHRDGTGHAHKCAYCDAHTAEEPHIPGAPASENAPQICTVCEYILVPASSHTHMYSNIWKSDEHNHWQECRCGEKAGFAAHTDINHDTVCDVCGHRQTTYPVVIADSYAAVTGAGRYAPGEIVRISAGIRDGYTFLGWRSADVQLLNDAAGSTSFLMPAHSVTVTAVWEEESNSFPDVWYWIVSMLYNQEFSLTASASEGGTISSAGTTRVKYGRDMRYIITPADGYEIEDVLVDGVSVGAVSEYRFAHVKAAHSITAVFARLPWQNPFADVKEIDRFYEDIRYVCENGLMLGTDEGIFSPDEAITRAMLVTILWRIAGQPADGSSASFCDVPANAWYSEAIAWAAANGIVLGCGDGTFRPEDPLTREQLAVILYRYEMTLVGRFTGTWMFPLPYDDAADAADWACEAIHWLTAEGLYVTAEDNLLTPRENATRAETAAFLRRYCEYRKEQNGKP